MRTAFITSEDVDVDVCYGDFDGHITRKSYCVEFFVLDDLVDEHWLKTEVAARMHAGLFEQGDFYEGEYGELKFDRAFRDEVVALMSEEM
jgi:hypothetical protein